MKYGCHGSSETNIDIINIDSIQLHCRPVNRLPKDTEKTLKSRSDTFNSKSYFPAGRSVNQLSIDAMEIQKQNVIESIIQLPCRPVNQLRHLLKRSREIVVRH
jgi:hypothetical protein